GPVRGRFALRATPHVGSGSLGSVASATALGRGVWLHDLCSGRRHRIPDASEGAHALTVRLSCLRIFDERVERVMVVRHLEASVGAPRRPDQCCPRAVGDARLPARDQWWPEACALSGAGTFAVAVLPEQIDRVTVRLDDDPAEA